MKPPEPRIIEDECQQDYFYNKTDDFDKIKAGDDANVADEVPASVVTAPMSKKRKFSFKHGKMSVTEETAGVDPDSIYLEVEGQEIQVPEECLINNSNHFNRVLEDISTNNKSEYLMNEEEDDEDETFSTVSYDSVTTVVDFIAKKIADLDLSESNVSRLQHVARLLGVNSVEKHCKKFVKTNLSVSNCFSRFSLADSFLGWSDTALMIQTFLELHFSLILEHSLEQMCESLNEVQLRRIISSGRLHVRSEDEVVEAVLAWVEYDPSTRAQCLTPLLEEVQYQCLSGVNIVKRVMNNSLIKQVRSRYSKK